MNLVELILAALTVFGSTAGAYAGVRAGMAETRQIAIGARDDSKRANSRLDAHLEAHRGD